jgi:hypothetical protein
MDPRFFGVREIGGGWKLDQWRNPLAVEKKLDGMK